MTGSSISLISTTKRPSYQELEREVASLRKTIENFNEARWAWMKERFHCFDAIRDERCPSCGSAVEILETPNSVTLKARNIW